MDKKLKSKPFVLWMTGLPCSGKSTIARKLEEYIENLAILDGDELRVWFSSKDFSKEGRDEHNRRVAHLAKFLAKYNVPVVVALISPYRENRETARKIIGTDKFLEIYVKCNLDICEGRDVKGMYKMARNNQITNFTGVQDPYEEPINPDVVIDTQKDDIDTVVRKLISKLQDFQEIKITK